MIKTKLFIIISVFLFISIFANIAFGFNIKSALNKSNELEEENKALEAKVVKEGDDTTKNRKTSSSTDTSENNEKSIVEGFFKAQYEYDHTSYKERFSKIKKFVSDDVYGQLTAAGAPDTPAGVEFENQINDLQIFFNKNKGDKNGLVLLDSTYIVDGRTSPEMTQIYRIKVEENKIVSLELVGTFSSMTDS